MLRNEEKEALRFEFSRLIRQKHQIGVENQGFKWLPKHEKHLAGVVKMIGDYERKTGDYMYFLRQEKTAAQMSSTTSAPRQLSLAI